MKSPKKIVLLVVCLAFLGSSALPATQDKGQEFIEDLVKNFSLRSNNQPRLTSPVTNSVVTFSLTQDNKTTSVFITDPVEWTRLSSPKPKKKRAFLEWAAVMAYSQASYWIRYSKFIEDWQYELTWEDQKRRFFTTEALRFDSNAFYLNWTHGFSGMLYYELTRLNHLSWWKSGLFSIASSLYWEYIVEWREIISINDNIMTGLGGAVLGEAWYQLGRYFFNSTKPVNRYLSWLNPLLKINNWFDRSQLLSPYHHHFNPQAQDVYLFLGYRNSPTSANPDNTGNLAFSFHSRLITDSSYGIPGKINEKFTNPFYTQFDVDLMYHGTTREEFGFNAKMVPVGRFIQNISEDRRGYSLYYGLGSTFFMYLKRPITEYDAGHLPVDKPEEFNFELPRDFRDKLAAVHIFGPVLDLTYFSSPWKLRLRAEAYPSFGMINSWPLNEYSVENDVQGMKSTLTFYGYYYGLGPALESQAEVYYNNLRLKGFTNYIYYRSIQGLDRFQSSIVDDSVLKDSRWHSGLSLDFRIPGSDLSVTGSVEWVRRWGRIHQFEDRNLEKRFYVGLKYLL